MTAVPENAEEFKKRQQPLLEATRSKMREAGTEVVIAAASDLNGVFRGKRVPAARFLADPLTPWHTADYFWAMDTEELVMEKEEGYDGWWPSWESGFVDIDPLADLSTFRIVPWLDKTASVLCEHFLLDGSPIEVSPRFVLRQLIERAEARNLVPKFAAELEFFLFRENEVTLEEKGHRAAALTPMNVRLGAYSIYRGTTDEHIIRPLIDNLEAYGLQVAYWNPEGGAGQYELNLVYCDLLEAADRAFLFKHAVKEIAFAHDMTATFMAKTLPGFGSSCHIHQSLWSPEGENLCFDAKAKDHVSGLLRHYVGGLLDSLAELTLMFAPNINSYKRFGVDSAAGTTASWGIENRTCGLRVINEGEEETRVENRVPGGDANPYLAMAASLAGGLHGIEQGIEPPEPYVGNAYRDPGLPRVPTSLEEAIVLFEGSALAKEYFGEEFVRFFAASRRWELEQFRANVTDWEIRRYLPFV